jgi:imidazoleglycerol-phosphate dehydratase
MSTLIKPPTGPARSARIERVTRETSIVVSVNFDGAGHAEVVTGVPFLDHMLDQLARHGAMDSVRRQDDLHIGAITPSKISASLLGGRSQALGGKAGLTRQAAPFRSTRHCRAS